MTGERRPRVAFVLEQTLGHVTHSSNLHRLVPRSDTIEAVFADIDYEVSGLPARNPVYRNWTVRAGVRARRAIRRLAPLDAMFIHTQVPAILCTDRMRKIPSVVSLDATPLQYDDLGLHYGHETGNPRVERLKWRLNRASFMAASALVTWSHWTKADLVDRYGVPAEKIHVIPPGVDVDRWAGDDGAAPPPDGGTRILFVGADFQRKGGPSLLDAFRAVRTEHPDARLDVVTKADVAPEPGVHVHRGLQPNSPELIALYRNADLFCLPTLGDCLPMVLCEAATMGLPLVSTDVGAISEVVQDGRTGRLVPLADTGALARALSELAGDEAMRRRLGESARRLVRADFDAATSASRLVELLAGVADAGASKRRR